VKINKENMRFVLKIGETKVPIELVTDHAFVYGVFTKKLGDYLTNLDDIVRENCKRYEWHQAKLIDLDKIGRPCWRTRVKFGENSKYQYRYIFLMRMVDCVAKLCHCSRKFALKHGGFYVDKKGGLLIFNLNSTVFGVLAPEIEVV